ncbi:D-TA family PLP-dependent enzyme [Chitinophaga sp. YIM B06452]|uniref:D-TA family PLP-dependent enzyme n=1 Tax=Chitinophaga sp. YIM B06452 TaxID=3082158 RepID=UPI0031FF1BDB
MQPDYRNNIASPALLVFKEEVARNIDKMISMAGSAERLIPHVKTHKMAPIVQMQLAKGITRFKCATYAEALMLAEAGAKDIVIAYQQNSPTAEAYAALTQRFPGSSFASLVDNLASAQLLDRIFAAINAKAGVYIDIDNGMHRTGIAPGKALALYKELRQLPNVFCRGLHAYDGHIRETDYAQRTARCDEAFAPVAELAQHMEFPEIIAGGTPTFPVHARRSNVMLSPGTCILWDEGYATGCPEQDYVPAALLLTRVLSKPMEGHITLDLGHKAVSAENPVTKRVFFHELPEYEVISQSEEHLVVKTPHADKFNIGDMLLGTPWHVCPTVALYNEAQVIENGANTGTWAIARGRRIN